MLRGEEAVQSIKAAAGTPPAPHSFPSALPFAAQAFDTAVPPLVTPPQRLRRRRGLLSATRRNRVPFPLGSARTPPPLTPCRVILVTETAAGIEGECDKGPVRAGGGWESGAVEARVSNRPLRFFFLISGKRPFFPPHTSGLGKKKVKGDASDNWVKARFLFGKTGRCRVWYGGVLEVGERRAFEAAPGIVCATFRWVF